MPHWRSDLHWKGNLMAYDFADDYYPDEQDPYYLKDDTGLGKCPECGSYLEMWGAVSQGDGDLCDELGCPSCQEPRDYINCVYSEVEDDFSEGEFE